MDAVVTQSGVMSVMKNLGYVPAVVIGISMESYTILAILLVLDVITGILRSAKLTGGDSVTSWKAVNGIMSKMLFLLIPLIVALIAKGIHIDLVWLVRSTLGILILSTGYSIIGNIYSIRTGVLIKEFDAVRLILTQLERVLSRMETTDKKHKD